MPCQAAHGVRCAGFVEDAEWAGCCGIMNGRGGRRLRLGPDRAPTRRGPRPDTKGSQEVDL
jgi:hypothetical protein